MLPRPWTRQPPPVGIAPIFFDVHVDELTWAFGHDLAHDPVAVPGDVEVSEPADPELRSHRCTVAADTSTPSPASSATISRGGSLRSRRNFSTRATTPGLSRVGLR